MSDDHRLRRIEKAATFALKNLEMVSAGTPLGDAVLRGAIDALREALSPAPSGAAPQNIGRTEAPLPHREGAK